MTTPRKFGIALAIELDDAGEVTVTRVDVHPDPDVLFADPPVVVDLGALGPPDVEYQIPSTFRTVHPKDGGR